jgi:RNA polymerase sigma-70 factor, ECF subfamily
MSQGFITGSRGINMSINIEEETKVESFKVIALTYIDSLYRFALYMTKNEHDARDLVQATYLRAYKLLDKPNKEKDYKVWLLKILGKKLTNFIRPNTKHSLVSTYRNEIFSNPLEASIFATLDELPVNYRAVVLLADMENLSYKEISDIIDCPIGTVISRLHEGRGMLRHKLLDYVTSCCISGDMEKRENNAGFTCSTTTL